ncbi:hypothetical protein KDM41_07780 [bacterium]|nr:hypothetical protein [bacterium]
MDEMHTPPPPPPPGPSSALTHPMGPGFGNVLGDMRFVGWVGLVYGILTCLSIAGAIIGVPLIIAAHRFIEGVNRFENYRQGRSEAELSAGFAELGRSFRLMKILVIIYIVLMVCSIALVFMVGGLGMLAELAEGS